jgi:hypothetical protein
LQGVGGDWKSSLGSASYTPDYQTLYAKLSAQAGQAQTTINYIPPIFRISFVNGEGNSAKKYPFKTTTIPSVGDQVAINSKEGTNVLLKGKVKKVEWVFTEGSVENEIFIYVEE